MGFLKTALLLSYICTATFSAALVTPALPQIQAEFHLSAGALTWIVSIFLLGYVFGQLIYGPLANRFGRLFALRVGLVINLFGVLVCIVAVDASSYAFLLLGRFVTALGAAAGLSCTLMLIQELLPESQAQRALSFAVVSFTLGIGLAVLLGGWVTEYFHWSEGFLILLVHGVLMLVLTWQFRETLQASRPLRPGLILKGYMDVLKDTRLVTFSLVVGICATVSYCYSASAPLIAHAVLHLTPSDYGVWNILTMIGMLLSGFLAASALKRFGPSLVLKGAFVLMVPCLVSLGLFAFTGGSHVVWFFVTAMFLFLFSGLFFPCGSFFAMEFVTDRANAASMMSFINMGVAMLMVIIMGYLPASTKFALPLALTGFYLLTLFLSVRHRSNDG